MPPTCQSRAAPPPRRRRNPPRRCSYEAAQKLFNARCVACHSCNNAPCQLKLTSYEGLQRGASKIEAIHPTRLQSIAPTRLGIDARSPEEWHKKGFFPVADEKTNLLISMINPGPAASPADTVAASHSCPANTGEVGAPGLLSSGKADALRSAASGAGRARRLG